MDSQGAGGFLPTRDNGHGAAMLTDRNWVDTAARQLRYCQLDGLTEPDRSPIPRCRTGAPVQLFYQAFEFPLVAGTDRLAGDDGGGLVRIDWHNG